MKLAPEEARRRFAIERVARLATADAAGTPHLVPFTFVVDGDRVLHAVDAKPKSTRALRRLHNIEQNPATSALADHYDENWTQLWWSRADGIATVTSDPDELARASDLLAAKYSQYRADPPAGPLIVLRVDRWSGWAAQPGT